MRLPQLEHSHDPLPLVIALNPSIDAEWRVTRVLPEEKNEVLSERRWPGGKGVNVARWLRHLGRPANLLLPLGGHTGRELSRQLDAEHLAHRKVRVGGATRVNIILTPAHGPQFRFNPIWQRLTEHEWRSINRGVEVALRRAACLVLSGSLPRGAPVNAYAQLIRKATRARLPAILDCDGAAFAAALSSRPFLVKPNEAELAQWAQRPLKSQASLVAAARELSTITRGWVLVSRGARGAILVNALDRQILAGRGPAIRVINTVGAGDALLAAVIKQIELGEPPANWLRWGVGAGTGAAASAAGLLPDQTGIRRFVRLVKVSPLQA